MPDYNNEATIIGSDESGEALADLSSQETGLSRRKFIRNAAVGAVCAGSLLALGGVDDVLAQTTEFGEATLDGVLLTYVAAPNGSTGVSTVTLRETQTFTIRLQATQASGLTISTGSTFSAGGFSVGSSSGFTQNQSTSVTDALTIRDTLSFSASSVAPGQPDHTVFIGLRNARLKFKGNPSSVVFKFLDAAERFTARADFLQSGQWNWAFSQSTINGMLAQYPLLSDPSGSTLVKPRFKRKFVHTSDPGINNVYTFETSTGSSVSSSFSATITTSSGFTSSGLMSTFQVGSTLTITLIGVQEIATEQLMSITFQLNPTVQKTFAVYKDKVFKTYLVVDKGPPVTSGQPVVMGQVLDYSGTPLPFANVKLTQNNVDFVGLTNSSGNYAISTGAGDPLATGSYQVVCGNLSTPVSIGSGTSFASFSGPDPVSAQNFNFAYNLD
jgi:hypothetical protein